MLKKWPPLCESKFSKSSHCSFHFSKGDIQLEYVSVMWWNLACNDMFPLENGVLDGIGQLSTSKCWIFEDMSKGIKEKVKIYKKKSMPNPLVSQLVRAMDNALIHMGSLKSPFGLMRFKVTEFQHLYLELYALLDYPEINKPCMDRHQPPATTITNCIGAFTNIPHIAQYFHRAGLPIWFLWPWKTGPF